MEQQFDDGYWAFAADALLQRLDAMGLETDGVRKGEDIEFVHRMRVASRRLRSAIAIFDACLISGGLQGFKKPIRRVTRELGAARDIDVQLEALVEFMKSDLDPAHLPGLERLELRLRQQRQQLQDRVVAAIDRLQGSVVWVDMQRPLREIGVRAQLRGIKPDSNQLRGCAVAAIALELEGLLSHETYIEQPSKVEELHQMRIAAKKLRYTIEVFAPLFDKTLNEGLAAAKEAQKILGEIHDCDVWIQMLPVFHDQERERTQAYFGHLRHFNRMAAGIEHMCQEKVRERAGHYEEFVAFWRETRAHSTWEKFHKTLYLPRSRAAQSNAAWSGTLIATGAVPLEEPPSLQAQAQAPAVSTKSESDSELGGT
jgi:CHAD domain-containing protein